MKNEQWLPVVGYERLYEVSNRGGVRGVDRDGWNGRAAHKIQGQTLAQHKTHRGHLRVDLYKNAKKKCLKVHRLVLAAFTGPCPPNMECRHINGNPEDNRLGNLAWGTYSENRADMIAHGNSTRGEANPNSKLNEWSVRWIKKYLRTGFSKKQYLADVFGVTIGNIDNIASGRSWAWLEE